MRTLLWFFYIQTNGLELVVLVMLYFDNLCLGYFLKIDTVGFLPKVMSRDWGMAMWNLLFKKSLGCPWKMKGLVQKQCKRHLMNFSALTRLSLLSLRNFWENLAFHTRSHCFCTRQKWHKRILINFSSLPTLSSLSLHNPWENLAFHKKSLKLLLH